MCCFYVFTSLIIIKTNSQTQNLKTLKFKELDKVSGFFQ